VHLVSVTLPEPSRVNVTFTGAGSLADVLEYEKSVSVLRVPETIAGSGISEPALASVVATRSTEVTSFAMLAAAPLELRVCVPAVVSLAVWMKKLPTMMSITDVRAAAISSSAIDSPDWSVRSRRNAALRGRITVHSAGRA
jgi:hypothetical protein